VVHEAREDHGGLLQVRLRGRLVDVQGDHVEVDGLLGRDLAADGRQEQRKADDRALRGEVRSGMEKKGRLE